MASQEEIQRKLKKKRSAELRAYFWEIVHKEGFFAALRRTRQYVRRRSGGRKGRYLPRKSALEAQRAEDVTGWPKISILVPVYNPNLKFFDDMLASVLAQTYPNWELVLMDGSDEKGPSREIVSKYTDERIIYETMENGGISENTNAAAKQASGHYFAFLDQDDILSPNAMYEMAKAVFRTGATFLYSDEALFKKDYMKPTVGHFKPDYSPQYLLCCNYIGHLVVVKRDAFNQARGLDSECDGAQDHDLNLRILDEVGSAVHIKKVLYYWRQHEDSTSTGTEAKPYVADAAKRAIRAHLNRENLRGDVIDGLYPSTYKVNYAIKGLPTVSIIIPNNEHIQDLHRCITSIYAKTPYRNFEIIVVENGSKTVETFNYYTKLADENPNCTVVVYDEEKDFNFSKICNFGRQAAKGEYLLFLNNDTEVIGTDWLTEMLQLCQLEDVGAVGAMLYYPDDTIQHAGVITGLGGYAGHSHKYKHRGASGYMFRLVCVEEVSAVTGACMMVKARLFDKMGGFDPGFPVAFNDVDFCLRMHQRGQSAVFTPYAELYHHESQSRGLDEDGPGAERFAGEQERLLDRYGENLLNDPYYNPYLTYDREDYSENDVLPEA